VWLEGLGQRSSSCAEAGSRLSVRARLHSWHASVENRFGSSSEYKVSLLGLLRLLLFGTLNLLQSCQQPMSPVQLSDNFGCKVNLLMSILAVEFAVIWYWFPSGLLLRCPPLILCLVLWQRTYLKMKGLSVAALRPH
jgi:hypothetical protein